MTRVISVEEAAKMEVVATGYKIFNDDWTAHGEYSYKVDGVVEGLVHMVDGDLVPCENGLHFCKNPLDCLHFYPMVQWNKFAKVSALGEVVDGDEGKSVARALKIDKVLNWSDFLKEIKYCTDGSGIFCSAGINSGYGISYSYGISNGSGIRNGAGISSGYGIINGRGIGDGYGVKHGYGINNGRGINNGCGIHNSAGICNGYGISDGAGIYEGHGINNSYGICYSCGISYSRGISDGYGVYKSVFCAECEGISMCVFAYKMTGKLLVFNKPVSVERFDEIWADMCGLMDNWYPDFTNVEKLRKANGGWWESIPAPKITGRDTKEAYRDMPVKLEAYIKLMPEFDAEIYKAITGRD